MILIAELNSSNKMISIIKNMDDIPNFSIKIKFEKKRYNLIIYFE